MSNINIMLTLPEKLVARAKAAGILNDQRVAQWLEDELERQKRRNVFVQDIEKLHALEPALSQEEIDAEIRAYRAEKAVKRKAGDN